MTVQTSSKISNAQNIPTLFLLRTPELSHPRRRLLVAPPGVFGKASRWLEPFSPETLV